MAEQVRIARAEGPERSRRQTGSLRATPAGVLGLQRRVGNRAVGQLLARRFDGTDGQWKERSQIVREMNAFVRAVDSDAALESRELERALNDSRDGVREKPRAGDRRFKRSAKVHLRGLRGESRLDWTPHDGTPVSRILARDDTQHDPDEMATRGKRVEEAEVAREAADEATIRDYARRSKGGKGIFGALMNAFARTYVPELRARLVGSRYDAGAKSFGVKVRASGKWTILAGDDVIARAAAGKLADLAEELRGAVAAIAEAEIDAGRTAIIWIGRERVRVSAKDQIDAARRIFNEVGSKYGITFDSVAARRASREFYGVGGNATKEQLEMVDVTPWEFQELAAFERVLKRFAPIFGAARKRSSRARTPQEIVDIGKLTGSPDDQADRGERFPGSRTAVLYPPDEDLAKSDPKYFDRHAAHELAHAVFEPQLDAFIRATGGWWEAALTHKRAKGSEAPPDSYADTNANEDLAQSVAYFFTDPDRLKHGDGRTQAGLPGNPCPKRFRFIAGVVGGWTPGGK
jgi:hypothetical protein